MNTKGLFLAGERGFHLLFDTATIAEAYARDAAELQKFAADRMLEIEFALVELLSLPTVRDGRTFVQGLPRELQHVLVLLYFEILEGRVQARQTRH